VASKVLVSKISKPYANALLELAESNNCINAITSEITDFRKLISSIPGLRNYLDSPIVNKNEKKKLLTVILKSKANPITLNFLLVLVDRRRIIYLDVIGEKFLELVRALEGLKIVNVQTILPLSYEQEETLINKLKNVTGAKKINLIRKLNKDILGGMILQIDYQVIDMSLKGKLRQISDILGVSLET
jgi:F-type H+-transporting ATPase subunit delta